MKTNKRCCLIIRITVKKRKMPFVRFTRVTGMCVLSDCATDSAVAIESDAGSPEQQFRLASIIRTHACIVLLAVWLINELSLKRRASRAKALFWCARACCVLGVCAAFLLLAAPLCLPTVELLCADITAPLCSVLFYAPVLWVLEKNVLCLGLRGYKQSRLSLPALSSLPLPFFCVCLSLSPSVCVSCWPGLVLTNWS